MYSYQLFSQVQKVSIIVQLLMGEIPERTVFNQPMLKKSLAPYLSITSGKKKNENEKKKRL